MARFGLVNEKAAPSASLARARRLDPSFVVWFLIALGVYALHGFQGELSRDAAFYVYAGQEVADGAAPYVEQMNRAGPLMHLLPGLGVLIARALDIGDVYGVRGLFWVLGALAVPLAYRVGSAAFNRHNAGHVAAAAMLSFTGFAALATTGPQSKTPIPALLAWALLLVLERRWLSAGIVAGLATLTWQPVLFAAAPAALVGCLFAVGSGHPRLSALARYTFGGGLTLAATSAYFFLMRAFPEFLDGFLLANARYTEQAGIQGDWTEAWELFRQGFGYSAWLVLAGLALLAVAGLVSLLPRQSEGDRWVRQATLALFAALVGGSLWSYRVFNGWADAFMLLPLAALGFGALIGALSHGWARLPVAVLAVGCALASIGATSWQMWQTRWEILNTQQAATEAIFSRLPEDATAITSQAPQALALSGVRNLSRYQLFTNGMEPYLDDHWPGGLEGYAQWIVEQEPTVLTTDGFGLPPWMKPIVRPEFEYVGRAPGFFVFVNTSVDPETRAEIGAALRQVSSSAR